MQEKSLPRRGREKLRQRQEILAAALDLFSKKGFHNVAMHEIAEKAEFAIGTLYKFFQNKDDLYKALVLEQCSTFAAAFAKVLEQPDNEIETLRNYVQVKGEMIRNNLPFFRLFLAESRGITYNFKAGLDQELRQQYNTFLEKLALVFESGIKSKRFRPISSPFSLALALDSTVNAFLLICLEQPEKHAFPEDPDAVLNIFFKGLIDE